METGDEAYDLSLFASRMGIGVEEVGFMWDLPTDIRYSVISNFRPSGTKDGNVLGRLQGYVRNVMKRHLFEIPPSLNSEPPRRDTLPSMSAALRQRALGDPAQERQEFARRVSLPPDLATWLAALPEELSQSAVRGFDPSGTKDGNVSGRFLGYVRGLWQRRLRLSDEAAAYIRSLPEEVQMKVMADFDASGSKDGNVSARLMGFANFVNSRHAGGSSHPAVPSAPPRTYSSPDSRSEGSRLRSVFTSIAPAPQSFRPPSRTNLSYGSLDEFVRRWNLDQRAAAFMQALNDDLRRRVLESFDASATKDGNAWGRLLGFVRSTWAHTLRLTKEYVSYIKSLPEDAQITVITDFDPHANEDLISFAQRVAAEADPDSFNSQISANGAKRFRYS